MLTFIKIIKESVLQAFHQLYSNKLRSFLSLLGISIGIFCIIWVLSMVGSMQKNVEGGFNKLGKDVIHVSKFSWVDSQMKWWKYIRRPNPNYKDYLFLKDHLEKAQLVSYHARLGTRKAKYKSNSIENTMLYAVSPEFGQMYDVSLEEGRFFSNSEFSKSKAIAVIGHTIAKELFVNINPIGKQIKVQGRKVEIVGVLEEEGDGLVKIFDFDDAILLPYNIGRTFANLKSRFISTDVSIKAGENISLQELRDESMGKLRAFRRLKPKEDDDFSLNEVTMLGSIIESIFGVFNLAGIFIGGFSMLVGMFSVANIMFVSVKERTKLIGIKKAIGAKRYVILLEFLIESIILSILGGIAGLFLVEIVLFVLKDFIPFEIFLSTYHIMIGILLSVFVGIIAGFIPAYRASKLDPVVAMRS